MGNKLIDSTNFGFVEGATDADLVTLAGRMTAAEGDIDTLEQTTVPAIDTRLTAAEGDIDTLEQTTVPALATRMTTAEGNITDLQTRMTTAEGDIDAAEADIANLKPRMTVAEGDIDSLETRMTAAEGNITGLQGRMTTAEGRITTNASGISSLNTRMGSAESSITNLQSRMTTAESDIDAAELDIDDLQDRMSDAEKQLNDSKRVLLYSSGEAAFEINGYAQLNESAEHFNYTDCIVSIYYKTGNIITSIGEQTITLTRTQTQYVSIYPNSGNAIALEVTGTNTGNFVIYSGTVQVMPGSPDPDYTKIEFQSGKTVIEKLNASDTHTYYLAVRHVYGRGRIKDANGDPITF